MNGNRKNLIRFWCWILVALALISMSAPSLALRRYIYYTNNTVCSAGQYFREMENPLTDKWYMYTPIDLSTDGKQTLDLITGNRKVIGKATITVEGDNVTVSYAYKKNRGITDVAQFFTIFPDYESITTVNPPDIQTSFQFDKPFSIKDDLNGDTDVLLFICNTVTYKESISLR